MSVIPIQTPASPKPSLDGHDGRDAPVKSTRSSLAAFVDMNVEHGFEPMRVEGKVPADLRGTLYRNGPGKLASFGATYGHWFDGDGALAAVRFGAGEVRGAARVTATKGLTEERRQGRALYAGFGTRSPRSLLTRVLTSDKRGLDRLTDGKNTANTSVMWDGERLLALWEGGNPTAIDPEDLATLGETDLGGVVARSFSAHPHRVPSRGTTYNHGMRHGRQALLDIYAKPDREPWRLAGSLPMPFGTMMHDIAYTERHVIAFVAPLKLQMLRVLLGLTPPADALRWMPELGTRILVAPLDDLTRVRTLEAEPRFFWHVANAHETEAGAVVDTVLYDDFTNNAFLGSVHARTPRGELHGRLTRTHLDLATGKVRHEELCALPAEFPIVAPSVQATKHTHVFMAAHGSRAASSEGLHDRIVSFDVARGSTRSLVLGEDLYPGEPIFVPREGVGETCGYLLTLVYDARAHTSHVAIVDAERLEEGPIAKAHFDHHVPFGFHGTWVAEG